VISAGLPLKSRLSFLTAFLLGFEERPFYSLNVPNDPREEGAFLEIGCDLMKAEVKIAREEIAELRREGANERIGYMLKALLRNVRLRSKSFLG
jgi:hypothetical protein